MPYPTFYVRVCNSCYTIEQRAEGKMRVFRAYGGKLIEEDVSTKTVKELISLLVADSKNVKRGRTPRTQKEDGRVGLKQRKEGGMQR